MNEDGLPYDKEAAVTNHQMQRLHASLINSLQYNVELFQMHNMEENDVQHDINYDHINVKVKCLNDFYQFPFLKFVNVLFSFICTLG